MNRWLDFRRAYLRSRYDREGAVLAFFQTSASPLLDFQSIATAPLNSNFKEQGSLQRESPEVVARGFLPDHWLTLVNRLSPFQIGKSQSRYNRERHEQTRIRRALQGKVLPLRRDLPRPANRERKAARGTLGFDARKEYREPVLFGAFTQRHVGDLQVHDSSMALLPYDGKSKCEMRSFQGW